MALFISARESCVYKSDFDYCMKNWKTLPNETITAWSQLERQSFRETLLSSIKKIVDDDTKPIPSVVPDEILTVLKEVDFHPITMLDSINKADQILKGSKDRILELTKLLANFWMESSYLTQILLSFVREPNTTRKMANTKSYFSVLFTMGEKLVEQSKFIRFVLSKVDTVLRVMVERDDARILRETFPTTISQLIDRVFVRFCTGMYRSFEPFSEEYFSENPFIHFMKSLIELCQRNYRIQRMLSVILLQIVTPVAQERIMCCWLSLSTDTSNLPAIPFYPIDSFTSNPNYMKSLIRTIPFDSFPNFSTAFWTNWANYLTSKVDLIPVIWDNFMGHFWDLVFDVTDGDRLKAPAFAFAALASAVKPKIAELKQIVRVSKVLDHITRLMETVDESSVQIAMALSHIIFDLDRVQQEVKTGKTISAESIFDCDAEIYLQLIAFYEGKDPVEIAKPQLVSKEADGTDKQIEEDDEQDKCDEGLDERVRHLRCAGLTPTSMKDVYHILVGEITGSNDSETEALKQIAVLSIPIILSSGQTADDTHMESIGRMLFEWGEDAELDDFLIVALFELGKTSPDIISNTLVSMIFGDNYSVGDKSRMLKITEKILIYCGTSRCVSCFSVYGPYKKDEMNRFISRMEPAFFPKYLHLNRDQPLCITCPPTPEEVFEETEESLMLRFASEAKTEATQLSFPQPQIKLDPTPSLTAEETSSIPFAPSIQHAPPQTRRWGMKRKENIQIVTSRKKTLHLSMWAAFQQQLSVKNEMFLSEKRIKDSVQVHFLLQILDFLRLLVMTYTGLSCFVQHVPKEALNLVQIYGDHPHVKIRRVIWGLMMELLQNSNICTELSLNEDINGSLCYADFFKQKLESEVDYETRDCITRIRKLYNYQKYKRITGI